MKSGSGNIFWLILTGLNNGDSEVAARLGSWMVELETSLREVWSCIIAEKAPTNASPGMVESGYYRFHI